LGSRDTMRHYELKKRNFIVKIMVEKWKIGTCLFQSSRNRIMSKLTHAIFSSDLLRSLFYDSSSQRAWEYTEIECCDDKLTLCRRAHCAVHQSARYMLFIVYARLKFVTSVDNFRLQYN